MFALALSTLLATTTPAVTVAQSCPVPDSLPVISYEAPVPPLVMASGNHGTAQLLVTLGASNGAPTSVELLSSSGTPLVDQAALSQARHTKFAPEIAGCNAVGGQYRLSVVY